MPLITDLANAIRTDEPANLFCLVEFGDHGNIVCFSSGKGWRPTGSHVEAITDKRVIYYPDNESMDAEQRMVLAFNDVYAAYGNKTQNITIITAASPCSRVCAPLLRNLILQYAGVVKTWVIAYHTGYFNKKDLEQGGGIDESLRLLNFTTDKVKSQCFQLNGIFVDPATLK